MTQKEIKKKANEIERKIMTKEGKFEKLKIISKINCRFEEIESYLDQLEEIEDKEAKNSEVDYSQAITSARGTLEILRDYFNWYKESVNNRD